MSRVSRLPPTISEAVDVLKSMENDIPPYSTLYQFATKLFLNKDKREMFMALNHYDSRLWYLKVEESEATTNEAQTFTSLLGNNHFNFSS
ncbi:unnamed protein product [Cuscuta campestris]|uniref:Uncharacterized protein n=1 Tax=Cuscuta campestris TaxID=132261 RepID=A0A484KCV1_9ASTE|nr:unnamed protein product [Cuscuta campestris]